MTLNRLSYVSRLCGHLRGDRVADYVAGSVDKPGTCTTDGTVSVSGYPTLFKQVSINSSGSKPGIDRCEVRVQSKYRTCCGWEFSRTHKWDHPISGRMGDAEEYFTNLWSGQGCAMRTLFASERMLMVVSLYADETVLRTAARARIACSPLRMPSTTTTRTQLKAVNHTCHRQLGLAHTGSRIDYAEAITWLPPAFPHI